MTKRIFKSMCVVALSVFLASLALFIGILYDYFSSIQRKQLKMQTDLAASGAAHAGMDYFKGLNVEEYRITWIDRTGAVLYDSKSDAVEMESHLEREEIEEAFDKGYGESVRYSTTLLERAVYCARRLPDGTVVRLSIAQNTPVILIMGMLQPICLMIAVAFILSLVLASRLSKTIVKPLNELDLDMPDWCGTNRPAPKRHLSPGIEEYPEIAPLLNRIAAQQEKIRQGEQMRKEFTANVSHELKTPLHTISGSAELMMNDMVAAEDIPEFSRRIYAEAGRMISLVEDILRLSHLDEGAEGMQMEETDLCRLAEETLKTLEPAAGSGEVSLELCGEPVMVYGCRQLLMGIIFNLCDNAIKYNRKGGSVSVSVKAAEGEAELVVSDTGIGIPDEHRERVFERFYRVDKSHSKEIGGTGLGLSIVKHAAMLHDARIEVESAVNEGTTVRVYFPASGPKS